MKDAQSKRNHSLNEIAQHIKKSSSFILLPHIYIDGDDLGSMIALSLGLGKLGKTCQSICHEHVPAMFDFLPQISHIRYVVPDSVFDCAVLIECTNLGRLPNGMNVRSFAKTIVNIDHHPGNGFYGDFNYIDCRAAAVGEIIYDILNILDIPIDYDIALSIYLAILTDTGGFQFGNTTARTHQIASKLLKFGLNVDELSRQIFRSIDFNCMKIRGEVISTLSRECDGKLVWGFITLEMMERLALEDGDIQHLIEDINVIRDAEIVVLFKEAMNGIVRVSMRSKSLPVNEVAVRYNGGGHMLAAGCTLNGTLEEVQKEILSALKEFIRVRVQSPEVTDLI